MRHPEAPTRTDNIALTDKPRTAMEEPGSDHNGAAEANSRLTGIVGLVLLALFLMQIATVLLGVQSLLSWHVAIGLVLVPPVLLKLGSTTWRMLSYYQHRGDYYERGAPPLLLRLLGPVLVLLTLALLGSGVVLLVGPGWAHSAALTVHKTSFYAWLAAITLHVVPHFLQAVNLAARDWVPRAAARIPHRGRRGAALFSCLALGALAALLLAGHVSGYWHSYPHR